MLVPYHPNLLHQAVGEVERRLRGLYYDVSHDLGKTQEARGTVHNPGS